MVNPRIDVRAQFAFLRLFQSPDPREAQQAAALFDAVETGTVTGIYGDDLGIAATTARHRGTVRWELVPPGQDAVMIDDELPDSPVVIFREQAGGRPRLDRALATVAADIGPDIDPANGPDAQPRVLERLDRMGQLGAEVLAGAGNLLGQVLRPPPTGPKPRSDKNGHQLPSSSQPHTDAVTKAEVYFATLNDELTDDDRSALDRLAAVLNSYGDRFSSNPLKIIFNGFADTRDAPSFPGGNVALSRSRADTCRAYVNGKLTTDARRSVSLIVRARGPDPDRATALGMKIAEGGEATTLQAQMRVVGVQCDEKLPAIKAQPPAPTDAHARVICLEALRKTGRFTDLERHRLRRMLQPHVTRFSFLNGMDRNLVKIAYGLGGTMTDAQAQEFADRFNVMEDFLKKGFIGGPEADLNDTIAGLKQVHQLMDQGISHLLEGTGKDLGSGASNQRRVKLLAWAAAESKRRDSVYFGWSSTPDAFNP